MGGTDAAALVVQGSTDRVGIGTATPASGSKLDVIGQLRTTTLKMTTSPTNNYVLKTDASGNGTWADPNTLVSTTVNNGLVKDAAGRIGTDSNGVNPLSRNVNINANSKQYNIYNLSQVDFGGSYTDIHMDDVTGISHSIDVGDSSSFLSITKYGVAMNAQAIGGKNSDIYVALDSIFFNQASGVYKFYNIPSATQTYILGLDGSNKLVKSDAPLSGSATLNFGSTAAASSADLTITVTGAADGDIVSLGVPNGSVNANSCYTVWVSAADTVTVRFNNYQTVGAIDPASGTFKVKVLK
jgi:hypothetical protein